MRGDGKFTVEATCEHGYRFKVPIHLMGSGYVEDTCPERQVEKLAAALERPGRVRKWLRSK